MSRRRGGYGRVALLGGALGLAAALLTGAKIPGLAGLPPAAAVRATGNLLWLPDTLRSAGLTVVEVPGWRTRGHDDGPFQPRAVIFHHDASPPGDSPGGLQYMIGGYTSGTDDHYDAQAWVDRRGVWYVLAAGQAQHAGDGAGWGAIPAGEGNRYSFGVETDHTTGELWPRPQLDSIRRGMAAICAARHWNPYRSVVGHREYAPDRKDDPAGIDLDRFRRQVADLLQPRKASA